MAATTLQKAVPQLQQALSHYRHLRVSPRRGNLGRHYKASQLDMASVALTARCFWETLTKQDTPWQFAFKTTFPIRQTDRRRPRYSEASESMVNARPGRQFTALSNTRTWRDEFTLRCNLLLALTKARPVLGQPERDLYYDSRHRYKIEAIHSLFDLDKSSKVRIVQANGDWAAHTVARIPSNFHDYEVTGQAHNRLSNARDQMTSQEMWGASDNSGTIASYTSNPNLVDVSEPNGSIHGIGVECGSRQIWFQRTHTTRANLLLSPIWDPSFAAFGIPATTHRSMRHGVNIVRGVISSVWIAKSTFQQNRFIGMMSGSSTGVVSAYSLGDGANFPVGVTTARWVISPGIPIIAIQVNEHMTKESIGNQCAWAMALNALGEIYFLDDLPTRTSDASIREAEFVKPQGGKLRELEAWLRGRSVRWHLIEQTKRRHRDNSQFRGPRSSSNGMALSPEDLQKEAKDIELAMWETPYHIRKSFRGWNMRRRMEVDFPGGGDDGSLGEAVIVFNTGQDMEEGVDTGERSSIVRYSRVPAAVHAWKTHIFSMAGHGSWKIETTAIDHSTPALRTIQQDLDMLTCAKSPLSTLSQDLEPGPEHPRRIPGQRARFVAAAATYCTRKEDDWAYKYAVILVFDARAAAPGPSFTQTLEPFLIIRTSSWTVTSLAISALHLVHGGSDGHVQLWDLLGSKQNTNGSVQALSTLHAKENIPRYNELNRKRGITLDGPAVGPMCLDPDPTVLRGVATIGVDCFFWHYSNSVDPLPKKKKSGSPRPREITNGDRFLGKSKIIGVKGTIRSQQEEFKLGEEHAATDSIWLEDRHGVGTMSEEEMLQLAQAMSLSKEESLRGSPSPPMLPANDDEALEEALRQSRLTAQASLNGVGQGFSAFESSDFGVGSGLGHSAAGTSAFASPFGHESPDSGFSPADDFIDSMHKAMQLSLEDTKYNFGIGGISTSRHADENVVDDDIQLAIRRSLEDAAVEEAAAGSGDSNGAVWGWPKYKGKGKGKGKA